MVNLKTLVELNKNLRKVKWILRILSNKFQLTLYNTSITNIKCDMKLVESGSSKDQESDSHTAAFAGENLVINLEMEEKDYEKVLSSTT